MNESISSSPLSRLLHIVNPAICCWYILSFRSPRYRQDILCSSCWHSTAFFFWAAASAGAGGAAFLAPAADTMPYIPSVFIPNIATTASLSVLLIYQAARLHSVPDKEITLAGETLVPLIIYTHVYIYSCRAVLGRDRLQNNNLHFSYYYYKWS